MRFLHRQHPTCMAKRVSVDTMRAKRGGGIPVATIAQWHKRGSAPSLDHLEILGDTYGVEFVAEVFLGVPALAAAAAQVRRDTLAVQLEAARAETERLIALARMGA